MIYRSSKLDLVISLDGEAYDFIFVTPLFYSMQSFEMVHKSGVVHLSHIRLHHDFVLTTG